MCLFLLDAFTEETLKRLVWDHVLCSCTLFNGVIHVLGCDVKEWH